MGHMYSILYLYVFLQVTLHVASTRRPLEERNVFQIEIVNILAISIPVGNSSFFREMIELSFKSRLTSIKHKYAQNSVSCWSVCFRCYSGIYKFFVLNRNLKTEASHLTANLSHIFQEWLFCVKSCTLNHSLIF